MFKIDPATNRINHWKRNASATSASPNASTFKSVWRTTRMLDDSGQNEV